MSLGALVLATSLALLGTPPHGSEALQLSVVLRPQILDYEVPGHPHTVGESQVGFVLTPKLIYAHDRFLRVEAGALLRWAFAHDADSELGAFPQLALVLTPFGPDVSLRLGSLDLRHGFHPGVLDEQRYAYGRGYEKNYNRSIAESAARDLGGDPFLPVENGAQLIARAAGLTAEVYLDWQLTDTELHREKFAVGLLGAYESRWLDFGVQYRLVHYGGQQFTATDVARVSGLDPKRQPGTLAITARLKPLRLGPTRLELPLAFLHGRMIQVPGEEARLHFGFEPGVDVWAFDQIRVGYRLWLPDGDQARFLSEDGDPVYSGPLSHRVSLETRMSFGVVDLVGRLDLVIPKDSDVVQTLSLFFAEVKLEPELWSSSRLP
jgi:hypothetical protein